MFGDTYLIPGWFVPGIGKVGEYWDGSCYS